MDLPDHPPSPALTNLHPLVMTGTPLSWSEPDRLLGMRRIYDMKKKVQEEIQKLQNTAKIKFIS